MLLRKAPIPVEVRVSPLSLLWETLPGILSPLSSPLPTRTITGMAPLLSRVLLYLG